jgi:hypothetical protein
MPDTPVRMTILQYGEEQIPVKIEYAERRRLSISVHPDCSVTALAPMDCSPEKLMSQLVRRRAWIAKQRRRFEVFHPLPEEKRFLSGETHLYLGRQYRLRVHYARNIGVKLIGRFFNVLVPQPEDPRSVRTALDGWYRAHAVPIFRDRMDRCVKSAPSLAGLCPELRIRRMTRRWGSCSRRGTITLSLDLIKTPVHCIEYVIAHELCHLVVHDHSPAFFRLLSRCMPDWERRKARLDEVVLR